MMSYYLLLLVIPNYLFNGLLKFNKPIIYHKIIFKEPFAYYKLLCIILYLIIVYALRHRETKLIS